MTEDISITQHSNHIAVVIDGVVQQMMAVDDRFAALLLSEPEFYEVTLPNGAPGANYGDVYNPEDGTFMPTQPHPSWAYDEENRKWIAPIPAPSDDKLYIWDEQNQTWVEAYLGE